MMSCHYSSTSRPLHGFQLSISRTSLSPASAAHYVMNGPRIIHAQLTRHKQLDAQREQELRQIITIYGLTPIHYVMNGPRIIHAQLTRHKQLDAQREQELRQIITIYGLTPIRESPRCLENVGPRRFLVVEFDNGDVDTQAARLWYLAQVAPLTLAVHSGGKSLHGWFYCVGQSEAMLRSFMARAVRIGADPATWTSCQMVRLPDGRRDDGQRQTTLYLNVQPMAAATLSLFNRPNPMPTDPLSAISANAIPDSGSPPFRSPPPLIGGGRTDNRGWTLPWSSVFLVPSHSINAWGESPATLWISQEHTPIAW